MARPRRAEMSDELYARVQAAIQPGDEIYTLANNHVNRISGVHRTGVLVETARSDELGIGPQEVPAWMIEDGWDHLHRTGELTQVFMLNDLNVKRSAFVCALLASFPDVVVQSNRPVVLRMVDGFR